MKNEKECCRKCLGDIGFFCQDPTCYNCHSPAEVKKECNCNKFTCKICREKECGCIDEKGFEHKAKAHLQVYEGYDADGNKEPAELNLASNYMQTGEGHCFICHKDSKAGENCECRDSSKVSACKTTCNPKWVKGNPMNNSPSQSIEEEWEDKHCNFCNLDFKGIGVDNTCPECGTKFSSQSIEEGWKTEFMQKCFDADEDAFLSISGAKANFIANWWLKKISLARTEERKHIVKMISDMTIETVGNSSKTVEQIIRLLISPNKE